MSEIEKAGSGLGNYAAMAESATFTQITVVRSGVTELLSARGDKNAGDLIHALEADPGAVVSSICMVDPTILELDSINRDQLLFEGPKI